MHQYMRAMPLQCLRNVPVPLDLPMRSLPARTLAHSSVCGAGSSSSQHRPADVLSDMPNLTKSSDEDEKASEAQLNTSAPPDRLAQAWQWFVDLRPQQKLYLIVALCIATWLAPDLINFGIVGVERMIVGSLMTIEEAVAFVFRRGALALAALGLLVFAAVGVQFFVLDGRKN